MLTDAGGLALTLFAIRFAAKEATPQRTYGYLRMEVLSALANAVVLLLLTVTSSTRPIKGFLAPTEVRGGPVLIVATIGLVVNLVSMKLLTGGWSESRLGRAAEHEGCLP